MISSPDGSSPSIDAPKNDVTTPGLETPQATEPLSPRSEAQRDASRKNGAKGRGPVSAEGKARSSQNAYKHGLRSSDPLAEFLGDGRALRTLARALGEEHEANTVTKRILIEAITRDVAALERGHKLLDTLQRPALTDDQRRQLRSLQNLKQWQSRLRPVVACLDAGLPLDCGRNSAMRFAKMLAEELASVKEDFFAEETTDGKDLAAKLKAAQEHAQKAMASYRRAMGALHRYEKRAAGWQARLQELEDIFTKGQSATMSPADWATIVAQLESAREKATIAKELEQKVRVKVAETKKDYQAAWEQFNVADNNVGNEPENAEIRRLWELYRPMQDLISNGQRLASVFMGEIVLEADELGGLHAIVREVQESVRLDVVFLEGKLKAVRGACERAREAVARNPEMLIRMDGYVSRVTNRVVRGLHKMSRYGRGK